MNDMRSFQRFAAVIAILAVLTGVTALMDSFGNMLNVEVLTMVGLLLFRLLAAILRQFQAGSFNLLQSLILLINVLSAIAMLILGVKALWTKRDSRRVLV